MGECPCARLCHINMQALMFSALALCISPTAEMRIT